MTLINVTWQDGVSWPVVGLPSAPHRGQEVGTSLDLWRHWGEMWPGNGVRDSAKSGCFPLYSANQDPLTFSPTFSSAYLSSKEEKIQMKEAKGEGKSKYGWVTKVFLHGQGLCSAPPSAAAYQT